MIQEMGTKQESMYPWEARNVRRTGLNLAVVVFVATALTGWWVPTAGATQPDETAGLDRLLDLYVRDGFVYYAALKFERASLDRYIGSVTEEPAGFKEWSPNVKVAFWLNVYNALVLRTIVDHYPIQGNSSNYPSASIRQVPGAFDRREHRVVGRTLTLDGIEQTVLPEFQDPRLYLVLGRGAIGSGRLRSEAYAANKLNEQLTAVVKEFATTPRHITLDRLGQEVQVSPIFGWREAEFVAAYATRGWTESGRTPIERAVLTFIAPVLFPSERNFLTENTFRLRYQEFDWRLNDLTGGRP